MRVASIRASIRRSYDVTRGIKHNVLDQWDTTSDVLRSESLRARGIVLSIQVSEMERAVRGLGATPATAPFPDVLAFKDYLLEQIGRINAGWTNDLRRTEAGRESAIIARAEAAYAARKRVRRWRVPDLGLDPRIARDAVEKPRGRRATRHPGHEGRGRRANCDRGPLTS
jgi:hypothetical protein